jgi:hypothetical protein
MLSPPMDALSPAGKHLPIEALQRLHIATATKTCEAPLQSKCPVNLVDYRSSFAVCEWKEMLHRCANPTCPVFLPSGYQ